MKRSVPTLLLGACLSIAAGCRHQPAPLPTPMEGFATGVVEIESAEETFVLRVEIAETPRQRRQGLMGRVELPADAGMLFLFDEEQPAEQGFWMYRTPIPLSIAFLDADGSIRGIRDMEPCGWWIPLFCPRYPAGVPFFAALEANRGYFESRGLRPGDRVLLRRGPVLREGARGAFRLKTARTGVAGGVTPRVSILRR